ncbi:MAG TPA: glycosyl hydrolase family 28-related protein [Acidimicrobiales bacterium]|nr:glycosyl hydrolase family 28-related protein [Acidimicrobiales bacterium]
MPGENPFFNVIDFGAKGDGRSDDAPAITAAIAAAAPASAPTGNTVYFPAGRYFVGSGVSLPPAVTLLGCGWNTPGSQVNTFAGSWIFTPAGANFSPVTVAGSGAAVRSLAFNVPDQSTSAPPVQAQPMLHVVANNALIEDIFLYNPYGGIFLDGAAQATIRRIWGQPVQYGIAIDRSQDTNYIDGLHFWPYWQPGSLPPAAYQLANGTAILLYRCDNPFISNVFAYNYNKGITLGNSQAGTPHKVHLFNADFDGCVTGIHVAAPGRAGYGATMQMANVTIQSPAGPGTPTGHGMWVEQVSSYAMVQASNIRISSSGGNAVRIDADNVMFYGENMSLENWRGNEGFRIASASSFAHLGIGCNFAGGGTPYAPEKQFRRVRLA